jgi:hypothetical protein
MGCGCSKSQIRWSAISASGATIGTYDSVTLAQKALRDAGTPNGQGAVKPVSAK